MSLLEDLHRLLHKYRALLDLRRERDRLEARGVLRLHGVDAATRRAQAQAVAQQFPGALRELENRTASQLQHCLNQVREEMAAAVLHPRRRLAARRWIRLSLAFHAGLREGLAIRRWLTNRRRAPALGEADLVQAFLSWYQHCSVRQQPLAHVDAAWLRRYRAPPGGRLTELIWQNLAAQYRCTPRTLRRHVLGAL